MAFDKTTKADVTDTPNTDAQHLSQQANSDLRGGVPSTNRDTASQYLPPVIIGDNPAQDPNNNSKPGDNQPSAPGPGDGNKGTMNNSNNQNKTNAPSPNVGEK